MSKCEARSAIDVGAKAEIHGLLCDLAKQSMAIMMISSDLPEILAMSDRVAIMRQGRIVAVLAAAGLTQEAVMHHDTGHAA